MTRHQKVSLEAIKTRLRFAGIDCRINDKQTRVTFWLAGTAVADYIPASRQLVCGNHKEYCGSPEQAQAYLLNRLQCGDLYASMAKPCDEAGRGWSVAELDGGDKWLFFRKSRCVLTYYPKRGVAVTRRQEPKECLSRGAAWQLARKESL